MLVGIIFMGNSKYHVGFFRDIILELLSIFIKRGAGVLRSIIGILYSLIMILWFIIFCEFWVYAVVWKSSHFESATCFSSSLLCKGGGSRRV